MLGDELEAEELEEATPSYLLPATPADVIGGKDAEVLHIPSAPLANH
jgi:hypothetical protein